VFAGAKLRLCLLAALVSLNRTLIWAFAMVITYVSGDVVIGYALNALVNVGLVR
jgi:hypothetical protein